MKTTKLKLLTILIVISTGAYPQHYSPGIKVNQGQVYSYELNATTEATQSFGGQFMNTTIKQSGIVVDSVSNVFADGRAEIIATLRDLKLITAMMGQNDTTNYSGVFATPTQMIYNKYGKIIARNDAVPSEQKSEDVNVSQILDMTLFCEYPEKNIRPGDKWTVESQDSIYQQSLGGTIMINTVTEYTLGDRENIDGKNLYKVTFTADMNMNGSGIINGMDLKATGTGTVEGNLYFDPATGVIHQHHSENNMNINIEVGGPVQMTIPMTQDTKVEISLME